MTYATVSSKGQVTIPKTVRESMRLQSGDKVEFVITEHGVVLFRPITKKVDDVFGMLYKKGRKPISLKKMEDGIRRKIRETFK